MEHSSELNIKSTADFLGILEHHPSSAVFLTVEHNAKNVETYQIEFPFPDDLSLGQIVWSDFDRHILTGRHTCDRKNSEISLQNL